jgi:hypothetical protein
MSTNGNKTISDHPNKQLGFEINPKEKEWSLIPEYYPDDFTEMKKKDMERHGNGCEGESVSVKKVKNREFHVSGVILRSTLPLLRQLADYNEPVDLISPLIKDGGMEVYVKRAERGNQDGWDPYHSQRLFEYDIDLVSSGKDEHAIGDNGIISEIIN